MFALVIVCLSFWLILGYAAFDILREANMLPRTKADIECANTFPRSYETGLYNSGSFYKEYVVDVYYHIREKLARLSLAGAPRRRGRVERQGGQTPKPASLSRNFGA